MDLDDIVLRTAVTALTLSHDVHSRCIGALLPSLAGGTKHVDARYANSTGRAIHSGDLTLPAVR